MGPKEILASSYYKCVESREKEYEKKRNLFRFYMFTKLNIDQDNFVKSKQLYMEDPQRR